MSQHLVELLRNWPPRNAIDARVLGQVRELMHDAADAIEELARERRRLKQALKEAQLGQEATYVHFAPRAEAGEGRRHQRDADAHEAQAGPRVGDAGRDRATQGDDT